LIYKFDDDDHEKEKSVDGDAEDGNEDKD